MRGSIDAKLSSKVIATSVNQLVDRSTVSLDLGLHNCMFFASCGVNYKFVCQLALHFSGQVYCVTGALRILVLVRV
jgi:hypothetical protein